MSVSACFRFTATRSYWASAGISAKYSDMQQNPNSSKPSVPSGPGTIDSESEHFLLRLNERERVKSNHVAGVKTVLVVLSSRGMVFDTESLRQKIILSYPESVVFFQTGMGRPLGAAMPGKADLLIDLMGPGQRQGIFAARKFRKLARLCVGRNAGIFRKSIYDRLVDEKAPNARFPMEMLDRERFIQKQVLALAGVSFAPMGDTGPDLGKSIALELPKMQKL